MNTAKELIHKAKVKLILNEPFFATLVLRMDYIEDSKVDTACTNGEYIKYNPSFIESKTVDQVAFVLAHEVLHPAFFHNTRREHREHKKWNRACDYPINELLFNSGFKEAENWLYDPQYFGMSAEQIYNMLPDEPEDGKPDPGECGQVEDAPGDLSESEVTRIEAEMKQVISQAATIQKNQGTVSAGLDRFIKKALEPKISWKEVLARFLTQISRDDYTFKRPNPRYLHTGFYLPYLFNITLGEVILIVDTSGSIDEKLLNQFGSEMQDLLNTFGIGFKVVYVDSRVKHVQEIEPDGPVKLDAKGGGGTDFKPGFEWIDSQGIKPAAVVYFTDGCCNSYPETPDYEVLWCKYGSFEFNPPFGEVVEIK